MTNTPMQALTLLNDPTYVEAARVLAERTLRESPPGPASLAAFMFRLATSRDPSETEKKIIVDLAVRGIARYRAEPSKARDLISVGESVVNGKLDPAELAGWTAAASVVLNLDETITRE
jgi:hypothetical protein